MPSHNKNVLHNRTETATYSFLVYFTQNTIDISWPESLVHQTLGHTLTRWKVNAYPCWFIGRVIQCCSGVLWGEQSSHCNSIDGAELSERVTHWSSTSSGTKWRRVGDSCIYSHRMWKWKKFDICKIDRRVPFATPRSSALGLVCQISFETL